MRKYAVISMDVEDWYHTYFVDQQVDRRYSMLDGLDEVLKILRRYNIRGSFFVVGEVMDALRGTLRKMDAQGHDIACHGQTHVRPLSMSTGEFALQIASAKQRLEKILGHGVWGYRAASFAIDDERLKIVEDTGFKYDSSKLKPQRSSKYGSLLLDDFTEVMPNIYRRQDFCEFEVSTQPVAGLNMLLGGGYIRMLPWCFMKYMHKRYLRSEKPYVLYIHPIDLSKRPMPDVPNTGFTKHLRTRLGRKHVAQRIDKVIRLLRESGYEFVSFKQLYEMNAAKVETDKGAYARKHGEVMR